MTGVDRELRVVSSGATSEEVGAATAVLRGALDELAAVGDADGGPAISAWQRQRSVRAALVPGAGAWRSFTG